MSWQKGKEAYKEGLSVLIPGIFVVAVSSGH